MINKYVEHNNIKSRETQYLKNQNLFVFKIIEMK